MNSLRFATHRFAWLVKVMIDMHSPHSVWTINEPHLPERRQTHMQMLYTKSPTVQDVFQLAMTSNVAMVTQKVASPPRRLLSHNSMWSCSEEAWHLEGFSVVKCTSHLYMHMVLWRVLIRAYGNVIYIVEGGERVRNFLFLLWWKQNLPCVL